MNKKTALLGTLSILLTVSFAWAQADNTQECMASICPQIEPFAHPFKESKELEIATMGLIKEKLKRPIELYMGAIIRNAIHGNKLKTAFMERKEQIVIRPEVAGFIQVFLTMKSIAKYTSAIEADSTGTISFGVTPD